MILNDEENQADKDRRQLVPGGFPYLLPWWFVMISFKPAQLVSLARIHEHGKFLANQLPWPFSWLMLLRFRRDIKNFFEKEVEILREQQKAVFLELGLESSEDQLERILSAYDAGLLDYSKFQEMQAQLFDRIQDDLKRGVFFMVHLTKVAITSPQLSNLERP